MAWKRYLLNLVNQFNNPFRIVSGFSSEPMLESKAPPADDGAGRDISDGMRNRLESTLRMRSNFSLRQPSAEFEPSSLDHTFPTGIANAIAADFDAQVRQVRCPHTRVRTRSTKTKGTSTIPWNRNVYSTHAEDKDQRHEHKTVE